MADRRKIPVGPLLAKPTGLYIWRGREAKPARSARRAGPLSSCRGATRRRPTAGHGLRPAPPGRRPRPQTAQRFAAPGFPVVRPAGAEDDPPRRGGLRLEARERAHPPPAGGGLLRTGVAPRRLANGSPTPVAGSRRTRSLTRRVFHFRTGRWTRERRPAGRGMARSDPSDGPDRSRRAGRSRRRQDVPALARCALRCAGVADRSVKPFP